MKYFPELHNTIIKILITKNKNKKWRNNDFFKEGQYGDTILGTSTERRLNNVFFFKMFVMYQQIYMTITTNLTTTNKENKVFGLKKLPNGNLISLTMLLSETMKTKMKGISADSQDEKIYYIVAKMITEDKDKIIVLLMLI